MKLREVLWSRNRFEWKHQFISIGSEDSHISLKYVTSLVPKVNYSIINEVFFRRFAERLFNKNKREGMNEKGKNFGRRLPVKHLKILTLWPKKCIFEEIRETEIGDYDIPEYDLPFTATNLPWKSYFFWHYTLGPLYSNKF